MKNYFLSAALLFYFIPLLSQISTDEAEVQKINAAYDEAIKNADVAFYEKLLAENYISYGPEGTKNRDQVLEELKKEKANPTYRINKIGSDDVKIKLSGNLAVVTAKWNTTTQSMESEETHDDMGNYMAVYEKRDDRWKLISEMGIEKPHTPEELEPSLVKASEKYDETLRNRDKEAFSKLLAEDYQSTNTSGKISNREEDVAEMFDPELKLDQISVEDKKFRIYRNSAVETGKYTVTGSHKGEEFTESGRYTTTWVYKDGKWQIVADHTSNIEVKE